MDQETSSTSDMPSLADRMAQATQSLADALSTLDGQFVALHAKIDRIVAAVDEGDLQAKADDASSTLQTKLAALEKANVDLKALADTARRKTLSPAVTALLAKGGMDGDALVEAPVIEKALAGLSVEQRIAVKGELARAGLLT